jgi:hypothetical protein
VASILLLLEVSEAPPQPASNVVDRPAIRPWIMVRFISSPSCKLGKLLCSFTLVVLTFEEKT